MARQVNTIPNLAFRINGEDVNRLTIECCTLPYFNERKRWLFILYFNLLKLWTNG